MKISAVIPCYNAQAFVGEAIDSVLAQTRAPDEIVVIDDGSTDASAEVVRGYGARVRLVAQNNSGIAAARNQALSNASGDWIAFLDADDVWPHDSLASRVAALEADAWLDYVTGLTEEFLHLGGTEGLTAPAKGAPTSARVAGAMLIRKALFERVGGFDATLKIGETMDWIARAIDAGAKGGQVEKLALRRRIHGANTVLRERAAQGDYLKVLRAAVARRTAAREG